MRTAGGVASVVKYWGVAGSKVVTCNYSQVRLQCNNLTLDYWEASRSEPHLVRSTVKSVLLVCLLHLIVG